MVEPQAPSSVELHRPQDCVRYIQHAFVFFRHGESLKLSLSATLLSDTRSTPCLYDGIVHGAAYKRATVCTRARHPAHVCLLHTSRSLAAVTRMPPPACVASPAVLVVSHTAVYHDTCFSLLSCLFLFPLCQRKTTLSRYYNTPCRRACV